MSEGTGAGAAIGVGFMAILSVFARNADGCGRVAARGLRSADDVVLASARHADDYAGVAARSARHGDDFGGYAGRAARGDGLADGARFAGATDDAARAGRHFDDVGEAADPWAPLNAEGARRGGRAARGARPARRASAPHSAGAHGASHVDLVDAADIVVEVVSASADEFADNSNEAYAPVFVAGVASLDQELLDFHREHALVLVYGPTVQDEEQAAVEALKHCAAYGKECVVAVTDAPATLQSRLGLGGATTTRLATFAEHMPNTTFYRVVSTNPVRVAALHAGS
ncbi:MAG: hypothetical protein AAF938_11210 [Myxococcota bacterium]